MEKLWKATGLTCLGFGLYSIAAGIWVILSEAVELAVLLGLLFLVFGAFYTIAGISLLRKGRWGYFVFVGMFGSLYWWGPGLPWYIWPMMVMPIIILLMFILVMVKSVRRGV